MLRLITPPAAEPLTLTEVKAHLGITGTEQDAALALYLTAVRETTEKVLSRAFMPQVWEQVIDAFPTEEIQLPKVPVRSIVEVTYDDELGDEQVLAANQYYLDNISEPSWIFPTSDEWGSVATLDAVNAVRVQFVAGYADLEDEEAVAQAAVPAPIKQALLLMLGHTYSVSSQSLFLRRETVEGVGSQEWTVSEAAGSVITRAAESLLNPYRMMLV